MENEKEGLKLNFLKAMWNLGSLTWLYVMFKFMTFQYFNNDILDAIILFFIGLSTIYILFQDIINKLSKEK